MAKKVYTLTCTWAPSYGAVLQAFALARSVQNLGYDTKILNYQPSWNISGQTTFRKMMTPLFSAKDYIFGRQYLEFLRDKDIITSAIYNTNEAIASADLEARGFIVGSDQVWNATKYYNGKDDAMFLEFAKIGQKRISYAASLAMPSVPEDQVLRYKNMLDKFDSISVREKTGEHALSQIGVSPVDTVIDPVYLVSSEEWKAIADDSSRNFSEHAYLLVVCLEDRDELYEYARKKADKLGLRLYSFRGGMRGWKKNSLVDKNYWNISVYDYLNIVRNARAVVTDSFHAMSFSLIFNRDVDVIARNDGGNSRMTDLLDDIGIAHRITSPTNLLEGSIDYEQVNEAIAKKVAHASTFLSDAIGDKE